MAGTPADRAQQAVTDRPEGLLATKFHLPHPPPGCVPRQRLDRRLDDSLRSGLTLVSAPAGFGKTTLLAEWCRRQQQPVAWLSLDAGDNDPVRFWRYTVAALERVRPGLAGRVAGLLGSLAPASIESLATTVVNELAAQGGDALLVLDDYHVVEAQPIHASLRFLLEHQPPALHIVLVSRADPPLPLARLRAGGRLAELRAADLVFNLSEAAALLGEAAGLPLGEDLVADLVARTEGWAAGLKLAGLSLPGQPDIARFVESFSGSHRYVLDYLAEEVLEQQPASLRGFLLETSVLDRLSGPLCDAVTGRADGQQMLQTIEAANLFLTPLDEVRGWWRYHHLFADLLRARLQQKDPERVGELHRRAAAWHHEHGHADDAVGHALAAGDGMRAARLAETYADELVVRSETASVQRWLAALPPELVASRPRLLLVRTRIALLAAEVEGVGDLLDAAERAAADIAGEPYEWSTGRASSSADVAVFIALGRAWLAGLRGDAEAAIVFAERARAELHEGEWMLELLIRWRLALADWVGGRLSDAERAFGACSGEFARAGELMLSSWSSLLLGQIQCAQGRLDAATETYQKALKLTAPADRPALPAAGFAYVGLGEVAYQRNDQEKALHYAAEGIRLCRHLANGQALAVGLATLAQVRQASGDPSGASDAIKEAGRAGPSATVTSRLNPVPALRARLLIAHGNVDAAAQWAAERGIGPDDEPSYPEEAAYLALARVLLAQDRPGQALRMLDRLHALAASGGRIGSVIEIQALRALALSATGDEEAGHALADALTLGARQGHIRVFADEGRPMAALLGRYVAARPRHHPPLSADYLGQLVTAFGTASGAAGPAAVTGLVTQLSVRELEVLRLLAAGKQNQRIADELYVTVYTVKKHVTHILDKLGAANRTEATTRARELGLIP
jgi:LuxR family maltose regulon positive regulatory protein